MSAYYCVDDDVAFGPISVEELNNTHLRRPPLRRHSADAILVSCVENKENILHADDMTMLANHCNESCILENMSPHLVNNTICDDDCQNVLSFKNENYVETPTKIDNEEKEISFNDTLEEIDRILNVANKQTLPSAEKISRIPIKKATIPKTPRIDQTQFKVPATKLITGKKINFVNTISPVATLIHKSDKSPLILKCKNQNDGIIHYNPKTNFNNHHAQQLPSHVTYKPAKTKQILVKDPPKIPNSVKRLLGTPVEIIKHEKRVCLSSTKMNIKSNKNDFTENTFSETMMDESDQHMSVVINKKLF